MPLTNGLATVEELVVTGELRDTHHPVCRGLMARALAAHLELIAPLGRLEALAGGWDMDGSAGLWPAQAHSPLFDFAATAAGAEWIDAIAARMTHTTTFDLPGVRLAPSPEEMRAFLDDYSTARVRPLRRAEREQIAAWATFVAAYVARCEHATGARGDGSDPTTFAGALRAYGRDYLEGF